jgi:hypothetical protein
VAPFYKNRRHTVNASSSIKANQQSKTCRRHSQKYKKMTNNQVDIYFIELRLEAFGNTLSCEVNYAEVNYGRISPAEYNKFTPNSDDDSWSAPAVWLVAAETGVEEQNDYDSQRSIMVHVNGKKAGLLSKLKFWKRTAH